MLFKSVIKFVITVSASVTSAIAEQAKDPFADAIVANPENLIINCEPSVWSGHRIGYQPDGKYESDTNEVAVYGPLVLFKSPYPKRGDSAELVYIHQGGKIAGTNDGTVLYSSYGSDPHIVIEALDGRVVAISSFNLKTGQATLTTPKAFLGFYVDTFATDQCESNYTPK